MFSKKIEDTFNDQLNFEMLSAYIYMSMGAHFDSLNLTGFANWMKTQYQEEMFHATKFYDFLTSAEVGVFDRLPDRHRDGDELVPITLVANYQRPSTGERLSPFPGATKLFNREWLRLGGA